MKILISMFFVLLMCNHTLAKASKVIDPFDLSSSKSKVKELGVVTKPEVDALEKKAKEYFTAGNCKKALPVLKEYSRKANWLANLISANLDPYYGANYDDRKEFPYNKIKPLIPLESLANNYKRKRNIAIAMEGECLHKIGNDKEAIPVLLKALDLIDLNNDIWWEKTRNNLLEIIKVQK